MKKEIQVFLSLQDAICFVKKSNVKIISRRSVSGGDINDAYCLDLSDGDKLFLKSNTPDKIDMFRAEMNGLFAIKYTEAIYTPMAYCVGSDSELGISFLLMEYVDSKEKSPMYWKDLGRNLANMHLKESSAYTPGGKYGFYENNYIGSNKQINTPRTSWVEFYRENRLLIQLDMAKRYFDKYTWDKAMRILNKLSDYLPDEPHPALLHGDLWGGNVYVGNDGNAWVIDPASYVGHFETDIAMTMMFGGFTREFYDSYSEINPIPKDFLTRRGLYDLYHYLNHLNLFGRGYLGSVLSIIECYG